MPDGQEPPSDAIAPPQVFELRSKLVMLASTVAGIFDVETRQIVQNIKNNKAKFTDRYAFELTPDEVEFLRSTGMISKTGRGGSRALPWAVTQKGAIRLATLMDAPKAIEAADIFIDVFTEVVEQIYRGDSEIEIKNPSRLKPNSDTIHQAQQLRKQIVNAVNDLLNTVIDVKNKTTVKDELGEIAHDLTTHFQSWLKTRKLNNDKVEAETLLVLEQTRDLYERRQSALADAAIEREGKALANLSKKIELAERLWSMYERLEPNVLIGLLPSFQDAAQSLPPPGSHKAKKA